MQFLFIFSHISISSFKGAKAEQDFDESNSFLLESQSLSMALTLLSVKVNQPLFEAKEWEKLNDLVPNLSILAEKYSERRVRILAQKLRNLIITHGIIRDQNVLTKYVRIFIDSDVSALLLP